MGNYLIFGVACLIILYGSRILDRLPKPKTHNVFIFELPNQRVAFRVETLIEDDFDISYVDGWNVGRGFSIYGAVLKTMIRTHKAIWTSGKEPASKLAPHRIGFSAPASATSACCQRAAVR